MKFLGYSIPNDGIYQDLDIVQDILSFSLLKVLKDLRRFLRMLNLYGRFLPGAAHHQGVLNAYLSGPNCVIAWSTEAF